MFVPLTIIENICFYPTLINFILFRQMAYQLIWVANSTREIALKNPCCRFMGTQTWVITGETDLSYYLGTGTIRIFL